MNLSYPRTSTIYKLGSVETFRLGSAKILRRAGENMQNKDKDVRFIFISDGWDCKNSELKQRLAVYLSEGNLGIFTAQELNAIKILFQVDQSGAEALIVAYLCKKGKYRDLFTYGIKPHVFVALHVMADEWRRRKHLVEIDDIDKFLHAEPKNLVSIEGWKKLDTLIKSSDDWAAHERYYYIAKMICHASCPADHLVLSRQGWISIAEAYKTRCEILVTNPITNKSQFEVPSNWIEYQYNDYLCKADTNSISFAVTKNHRIPFDNNNRFQVKKAVELVNRKYGRIPTACEYTTNQQQCFNPAILRLLVAIQADGHIEDWNTGLVTFNFKKDRKQNRLKALLTEYKAHIKFENAYFSDENYVTKVYLPDIVQLFKGQKLWGDWLLNWSKHEYNIILDELSYWDGSISSMRNRYFTKHKQNAEWIQTIAHLSGNRATIGEWPSSNGEQGYCVTFNFSSKYAQNLGLIVEKFNGLVYSPTVSTGFFLIKHNGKISITGNSNYGMKGPTFALNTLQKSEGSIRLSEKEATNYLEAYHKLFPEIRAWHMQLQNDAIKQKMFLYNLFGEPREFTGFWGEQLFKKMYAFIPQSTVGEITNRAILHMHQHIREDDLLDTDLLQNGHDAGMGQTLIGQEQFVCGVLKYYLSPELMNFNGERFQMKAECQAGFNWAPAKIKKRKDGTTYKWNSIGLHEVKI